MLVDVSLPIPSWTEYTYEAHEAQVPPSPVGCRVLVPVRSKLKVGFCVRVRAEPPRTPVLPVREFIDESPPLPQDLWNLGMWMSWYYFCPPGLVFSSMLPDPSTPRFRLNLVRSPTLPPDAPLAPRLAQGPVPLRELRDDPQALGHAAHLVASGWATWVPSLELGRVGRGKTVAVAMVSRVPHGLSRASARVMDALLEAGGRAPVADLMAATGVSRSTVERLARTGLVRLEREGCVEPPPPPAAPPPLSPAQVEAASRVIEAVRARQFRVFALHGVTGSGKTEVYLAATQEALAMGASVILLVPEIGLAAHMVGRVGARLGARVVVFHSGLSPGERASAWARASQPGVVVVGPRSAVFAPVFPLGLVVVDEEHDASYKQERDPRYHGRDVAIMRAREASCPVILGSATPSLETYHHALSGKYTLLSLPHRVDGWPMPTASVVDMRAEPRGRGPRIFSALLRQRVESTLERGEQVLLLLNRRGYARSVQCGECGNSPLCPRCEISLTYHKRGVRYLCHYCEYAEPAWESCPRCGSRTLHMGTIGTERVEDELRRLFPHARVVRMDRDTTRARDAHHRLLSAMERGEANVLIGTQMVAKGFDLPHLTLVGIINADTPLQFPDFRAPERTFQLLTQVAGRAGRNPQGGEVVFQSFLADHPCIQAAARQDFESFASQELAQRREAGYPPFTHLVRLEVCGPKQERVEAHAALLGDHLRRLQRPGSRVLGPAAPLLAKLGGLSRRHLLVFCPSRGLLHQWVRDALAEAGDPKGVRVVVDVDPVITA